MVKQEDKRVCAQRGAQQAPTNDTTTPMCQCTCTLYIGKSGGEYGGRRKDGQWSGVLVGGVDLRLLQSSNQLNEIFAKVGSI